MGDGSALWILLGVLGFFGVLVVVIILVKKKFSPLQIKKDDTITEEEAAKQELDRILVPVEDEETLKAMEESRKQEEKKD